MEITRTPAGTRSGPDHWFTGQVWMEELAAPPAPSRVHALRVHFTPGARTAWHRHALGQVLYVTEGVGLVQRRGAPPQTIRAGDVVWFEPDEDHWHGAAPDHFMTHIAIHELDHARGRRRLGRSGHRRRVPADRLGRVTPDAGAGRSTGGAQHDGVDRPAGTSPARRNRGARRRPETKWRIAGSNR